ncbi:MAG: IS66 family insertion sequence element accessory protein TnpB [Chthoniobacteraceae bacterium]
MEEEAITNELMKVDRRGHVRVSAQRREVLLDEFERCGVSAAEFAAQIGVKYSTFAHWRQMRERKQTKGGDLVSSGPAALLPAGSNSATRWAEAVVEANGIGGTARGTSLKIALPGGARLEISETAQMKLTVELLRALEDGRGTC